MSYAAIGLVNPKSNINVGSALRAANAFGATFVATTGRRYHHAQTDTQKAIRHLPLIQCAGTIFDALPFDCIPIAVDLLDAAVPLETFIHPKRAFYIFGAEDATLGAAVTARCKHIIKINTRQCLNLAAAVNVVLYDRNTKRNIIPHER